MIRSPRSRLAVHVLVFALISIGAAGAVSAQPEPADVPDAVRIPRPSAAELETARQAFAEFVRTTDSATRAVLERYPGILEVRPPRPNSGPGDVERGSSMWL